MLDVTSVDTYTLRGISELIDKEVSDYLSIKLPEVVEGTPSPAPAWYTVFSPLCSKLIYDMLLGILPMDEFSGEYSDQYVRERLRGYDWILPYDPAIRGVNENYVVIHPHPETDPVELSLNQYRLLGRVIDVFLGGKVDFSRYTVIVEETPVGV